MPDTDNLSLIVAASENGVIGNEGDMPWRLSADLKRFKRLTMGHSIIMGRKTYDSIGRLLPGRTTVIVTRQPGFAVAGAVVVKSIEQAIEACRADDRPFVIGGGEIYRIALPWVTKIHLTRVHTTLAGDTVFPEIDWDQWELLDRVRHPRDEKNSVAYSFETHQRRSK